MKALLVILLFSVTAVSFAKDKEEDDDEDEKVEFNKDKCTKELAKAFQNVQQMATSKGEKVQKASEGGGPMGGNPISQMIQKMAEADNKMVDAQIKQMEALDKINTEEFKELNNIQDKLQAFRKQDYDRKQQVNIANNDREKAKSQIRAKCNEQAKEQYNQLIAKLSADTAAGLFQTSNLGGAAGTRQRMYDQRRIYYQQCLSDPSTVEQLNQADRDLSTKMANFKIQSEQIASDVNYTQSKIPQLSAFYDQKKQLALQESSMRINALQNQQAMQMMALGTQIANFNSASGQRTAVSGQANSFGQLLGDKETVYRGCLADGNAVYDMPLDADGFFTTAKKVCKRPGGNPCVRSTGMVSADPPSSNSPPSGQNNNNGANQ